MKAEKINPYHTKGSDVLLYIKRFFLGRQKPDIYTRVICNIGLLAFFFYFIWTLIVLLALHFGQNLPRAANWNHLFEKIGNKYQIQNIQLVFDVYLIVLLLACIGMFVGLILVWRRKKPGYWFFMVSLLVSQLAPLLIMGVNYYAAEIMWYEWISATVILSLFVIDYLLQRRKWLLG
jgi:hypothetical protein